MFIIYNCVPIIGMHDKTQFPTSNIPIFFLKSLKHYILYNNMLYAYMHFYTHETHTSHYEWQ